MTMSEVALAFLAWGGAFAAARRASATSARCNREPSPSFTSSGLTRFHRVRPSWRRVSPEPAMLTLTPTSAAAAVAAPVASTSVRRAASDAPNGSASGSRTIAMAVAPPSRSVLTKLRRTAIFFRRVRHFALASASHPS